MNTLAVDRDGIIEPWSSMPTDELEVSISTTRLATLDVIPAGMIATDYEWQFRPAPSIDAQRLVDMTLTLDANESATSYEYQLR